MDLEIKNIYLNILNRYIGYANISNGCNGIYIGYADYDLQQPVIIKLDFIKNKI